MNGELEIFTRLALSFGIGLIVGIERGWRSRDAAEGTRTAGLRTFTLIGFLGGILATVPGDAAVLGGGAAVLALMVAAYVTRQDEPANRSLTTEVAALITYALGVLAVRGDMALSAAAVVLLVTVLHAREPMHAWLKTLERVELKAALQLLVISVVVLPVLPDKGFGPGSVLNPYELWWMVVVIVGISFIAVAATKWLGARAGVLLTGVLGGLASSTAVAVGYARLARETPAFAFTLATGVGAATALKFLRTLAVVALITPAGAMELLPSIGLSALLVGLVTIFYVLRRGRSSAMPDAASVSETTDLTVALTFGAVLAAVTLAAHYGRVWFGAWGVVAVAALSGLVDVDAVSVSAARDVVATSDVNLLVLAVPVALAVNTLAKLACIQAIAGAGMARPYAGIAAAAIMGLALGAAFPA
ncbi:MAG: DUF4010 domain-containing protein [Rhodospirillaceae bacterium]|nr:DUF4010 domain-containing protein [Rhodospirillaceae bacterium]